jgi:HSP20 family protein
MLGLWDPFADLARFDRRLRGDRSSTPAFKPAVDIYEGKDAIVVKAELPGVKVEDVAIQVENHVLTLSGERKLEKVEESPGTSGARSPDRFATRGSESHSSDGWHRVESTYGAFSRSFQLPETVDAEAIDASMTDGVLTLKLPKRTQAQPRRIQVKAGAKAAEAQH